MQRSLVLTDPGQKSEARVFSARRPAREDVDLHQTLPPAFADLLAGVLREDAAPLATLFVDADEVLGRRVPARALVVTGDGVLFLEAGETTIQNTAWGVKSLFYPFRQITAVGIGAALLTGRFTLYGPGGTPLFEIALRAQDVDGFAAVAGLIGEQAAAPSG